MIRKGISFLLAVFLALTAPLSAYAVTEEEASEAQLNILAAVQELETVMEESYERAKKEAAALSGEGYDYELTMESMEVKGAPYADFDYRGFLAAYATIRVHCEEIGDGINRIPFIGITYTEEQMQEYIPVRRDRYVEDGDGLYVKDGYWYVTEPCTVDVYTLTTDGVHYKKTGTNTISLQGILTVYADVTASMIELEDIYEIFGLNREDFIEEEEARLAKIEEIMGDAKVEQSIFLQGISMATSEDAQIVYAGICMTDNPIRQVLLAVAASIIGQVPYEWGGKADHAGFDPSWFTFDETGRQKGLDCSGYTQWVLRTAGYTGWANFGWTGDYLESAYLDVISQDELQPGDFGLFYPNTDQINHIGIYLGGGYWIHCSSGRNTVVVSDQMKFSVFRRLSGIDNGTQPQLFASILESADAGLDQFTRIASGITVEDPDLMLMAKIVQLEAQIEGYNGWIAVAEVIKNRILSPNFPNSVYEVVSAPKQFATWAASQELEDSEVDPRIYEVCVQVMAGTLGYLNNEKVIGFRTCRPEPDDFTFSGWDRFTILGNHSFYYEE